MSTETSNSDKSTAREHVERKYDIQVWPSLDWAADLRDVEPQADDSNSKAQQRAFAIVLSDALNLGKDPYEKRERTYTDYIVTIGDEEIEMDRSDDFDALMRAAANYGGQHPLGFEERERPEESFRNSPGSVFGSVIKNATEAQPDEISISEEFPTFYRQNSSTWETGDGEQKVSISTSSYSSASYGEHPEGNGAQSPYISAGVTIKAEAEAAVDLLESNLLDAIIQDFEGINAHLTERSIIVRTSEKTTEVCKRTE
jgi:hypothetical protein